MVLNHLVWCKAAVQVPFDECGRFPDENRGIDHGDVDRRVLQAFLLVGASVAGLERGTGLQDIGKITLIEDWELPAQLDWKVGFTGIAGTLGSINGPSLYNDETHCLEMLYHYTADRYELLEELVMLNPTQTVERVWLRIRPKGGSTVVVEWDMSEPYEIFPGDDVTVYASYRDENMNTLGYHTVTASYLLCTSDGESYCRFAYCDTNTCESDYLAYAILFDGLDLESYYWDFYYLIYEPWRYDPEATPMR